uniref:Uncharacterized protein n=1 Tax=Rhizophora mucronata TaxID=61149 RepID=A0A2P2NH58_RHIMU
MRPFLFSSYRSKASRSSEELEEEERQREANSSRLMKPSLSASISSITSWSSSVVYVEPMDLRTSPSSPTEILPSPLESNWLKICWSSSILCRQKDEEDFVDALSMLRFFAGAAAIGF